MPIKKEDNAVKFADIELTEFLERKTQLKLARVNWGVESIWKQADKDYLPHELGLPRKKHLVENIRTEVSSYVNLESDNWRSKLASNDPYIKIQTALSILFDRNPEGVFEPKGKQYTANTKLIENLYHQTWNDVNLGAKKELRKFIFNLAKYGWAPARRYYRKEVRKDLNVVKNFDSTLQQFEYDKKDITDVDDVYFQSLTPFDVWMDDGAKPDDPRSRRDWMWREVYDKKTVINLWGQEIAEKLIFSNSVEDDEKGGTPKGNKPSRTSLDLTSIYFYENRLTGRFIIESNEKLIKADEIMIDNKELSLVDTFWTLKSTECPYGIGINEIMRNNKVMYDRIRNMTIDQVVLSIYKMFFFSNAEQLADEGGETIDISPGKGKKVIDPKNITWMDVPGPGRDSYIMQENLIKDIENDTGINRTLGGEITGKTLGEVQLAKEGALKRLAVPLRSIKSMLEWDALLCVNLIKMVYSVPKVYSLTDPELIANYIVNIEDDKERYFVDENGVFNILKYREFQFNLENNQGNFKSSNKKQFFTLKPSLLEWSGQITIRVESMIEQSQSLQREETLQISNLLIPIIAQMAANPVMVTAYVKSVKEILKTYDKDPADWLPAEWLVEQSSQQPMQPIMNTGNIGTMQNQTIGQAPEAQTVVPKEQITLPGTNVVAQSQAR